MTDKNQNSVSPIVAGLAGAVAGGVAVASAFVMSDKKNQKKVKDVLTNVKDQAVDYIEDMQKKAQDVKSGVATKIIKMKKAVQS